MSEAEAEARRLLQQVAAQFPNDPAVQDALGFVEQKQGNKAKARQMYNKALSLEPDLVEAETNLGVLDAQLGDLRYAVRLWQDAFQRAPGRSEVGLDLARALCAEGQIYVARDYTLRVLEFNPDFPPAKTLLKQLNSEHFHCSM